MKRTRWVAAILIGYRPAMSSDKAEDLQLLGSFFLNLPPFRFILKFFRFFRTLLVIANNIDRHIEVLLFSTSFVISVQFGDVKTEKNRRILGHRQVKYRYIFRAKKSSLFAKRKKIFCLYFIMLEGLRLLSPHHNWRHFMLHAPRRSFCHFKTS